ncbi:MAG: DISARM system phospholipase D-like protein DrmC [Sedimentisphaerales bacterium]
MCNLWESISEIALELHPDIAEVLAQKISSLRNLDDLERTVHNLGPSISKESVEKLKISWKEFPEVTPIEIASALRGASTAIYRSERNGAIELVWTGPPTGLVPTRHTEQVLLEVIESANHKLFIVSFVAYNIESVIRSLEKAIARKVQTSVLLESSKTHGGKVDIDSIHTVQSRIPSAKFYRWKSNSTNTGGSVHAKCAVSDSNLAFITSANLTMAAMEKNMELGILVRGGNLPKTLQRHLESLVITDLIESI